MTDWLSDPWHVAGLLCWNYLINDAWNYRRAEFSAFQRGLTAVVGPPALFGVCWAISWMVKP